MPNEFRFPVQTCHFQRNSADGYPVDETTAIGDAAREAGLRVHRVWTDGIELRSETSRKIKLAFDRRESIRLENRAMDLQRRKPGWFKPDRTDEYARGIAKTYVVDFDREIAYAEGAAEEEIAAQAKRRTRGLRKGSFLTASTE